MPEVVSSLKELLGGTPALEAMSRVDSLSGATFSRVTLDGQPYVVKWLDPRQDWVMRASGDTRFRPLQMWESGLFSQLPPVLESAVVGVARHDGGVSVLMRDIGEWLVPEGDAALDMQTHDQVLRHMAALHRSFWGWTDDVGLCTQAQRITVLSPRTAANEGGGTDPVPNALAGGWSAMQDIAPEAWKVAVRLADDPTPLVQALSELPQTLIHGDWKGGNLGILPGGRTALLDWAFPGQDSPLCDLGWYLAVNCDRLPESKDQAVRRYRDALSSEGIRTEGWWDDALALAQLVTFVQMGWSKSGDELQWWAERALAAAELLS